jgi:hypothetical protein
MKPCWIIHEIISWLGVLNLHVCQHSEISYSINVSKHITIGIYITINADNYRHRLDEPLVVHLSLLNSDCPTFLYLVLCYFKNIRQIYYIYLTATNIAMELVSLMLWIVSFDIFETAKTSYWMYDNAYDGSMCPFIYCLRQTRDICEYIYSKK